nr:hypothetical protein GTC16762_33140 [Pigmentibacter ruber]
MINNENKNNFSINKYSKTELYINCKILKEINDARKLIGLKELSQKDRKCICCNKIIKNSTSERLCQSCRNNANNTY